MRKNNKCKIILINMFLNLLFSIVIFITKEYIYEKGENLLYTEEQKNNNGEITEGNSNTCTNISDTMKVIAIPQKEIASNITDWNLILVNKNNKIPENYEVNLSDIENNKVDSRIAEALKNMLADARKEGLNPIICSGYRTKSKQNQLYNNKIKQYVNRGYNNEKARELASYWVAIPDTSEHQTGLAVDIVSKSYQVLDDKQEKTEVQKWLIENSYKYGFILRYPTDKKEITMINYEPWHYRYVGIENANYMKKYNICLEEYIDYLKQFEQNLV